MSEFRPNETVYTTDEERRGLSNYMAGVFGKMGIGLLVTAAAAFLVHSLGLVERLYVSNPTMLMVLYLACVVAEFSIVIGLSRNLLNMQTSTATALFYTYAAITGMTFSVLLEVYAAGTVAIAFAFSALVFFSSAIIGHFTDKDLTSLSGILTGGLIALIVCSILGMFIPAIGDSLLLCYLGIGIFVALTAFDTQRLKKIYYETSGGYGTAGANLAVYGAFELYLDFINIFLYVLRIFGRRNN
jgi:FtsH-binding integral membrane protein